MCDILFPVYCLHESANHCFHLLYRGVEHVLLPRVQEEVRWKKTHQVLQKTGTKRYVQHHCAILHYIITLK